MGDPRPLLWLAAALGVAGLATLRFAWSLPQRSAGWNGGGWTLLGGSSVAGALAAGAWGVAVAALPAMAAALLALAFAGVRSPPGRTRASSRRVGMLPERGEPRRIGRRVATFVLVVPVAFLAALALALALRGLGGWLGWSEANGNVIAFYTVPLAWALLATVLLMQARRRNQFATLLACALPLAPMLLAGTLAGIPG